MIIDKQHIKKLRQHYMQHPPEGMTSRDIQHMSDNDLLDMDYFLHKDNFEDDGFGEEGFYIL